MSENLSRWLGRNGVEKNLFKSITDLGRRPTHSEIIALSKEFRLPEGQVLSVLSAYDFLKVETPPDEHICVGTSCLMAGAKAAPGAGKVSCLGRCYENSSRLKKGKQSFSGPAQKSASQIPTYIACKSPLLITKPISLDETLIALRDLAAKNLLSEVSLSSLRGRGGAGFPFSTKLSAFLNAQAEVKYIVCNADEGDPGAFSDKYLLEEQLYKVLFGMAACGLAGGAKNGIIYLRFEYPDTLEKILPEVEKFNARSEFKIIVIRGAGSYVCGEETALLNSLEGQRPEVRIRPPFPTNEGLYGQPTLLSNVETFACVYPIAKLGGALFASLGTRKSTGTKLICLDGRFSRPGVYEIEMGESLIRLIDDYAMGPFAPLKAIQVGGPLGGIVPASLWTELSLDFESFSEHGFLFGHGSIVGIPSHYSMFEFMKHLFEFSKDESCGKCYPCRIGTEKIFSLMQGLRAGEKIDDDLLLDTLDALEKTSLCGLGGGLPLPIKNILAHFADELPIGGRHG